MGGLLLPDIISDKPSGHLAKITHVGLPLFVPEHLYGGDQVMFLPDSNYESDIRGESYYCMRQQDIYAVKREDWLPVNDFIKVTPCDSTKLKSEHLILMETNKNKVDQGIVVAKGMAVKELEVGDKIMFESNSGMIQRPDEFIYMREGDVFGTVE